MKLLTVTFLGSGYITVDLDAFFPCSKDKCRALISFIKDDYEHCNDLFIQLSNYFFRKMLTCQGKIESAEALWNLELLRKESRLKLKWQGLMNLLPKEYRKEVNRYDEEAAAEILQDR